jgi:hypothetical protein
MSDACKHPSIRTWRFADDGDTAPLWSCVDCGRRFEPIGAAIAAPPGQEDAKDAARYRWLRSTTNWASSNGERVDVRNNPQLWDSAIDACISKAAAPDAQKGAA